MDQFGEFKEYVVMSKFDDKNAKLLAESSSFPEHTIVKHYFNDKKSTKIEYLYQEEEQEGEKENDDEFKNADATADNYNDWKTKTTTTKTKEIVMLKVYGGENSEYGMFVPKENLLLHKKFLRHFPIEMLQQNLLASHPDIGIKHPEFFLSLNHSTLVNMIMEQRSRDPIDVEVAEANIKRMDQRIVEEILQQMTELCKKW